MKTHTMVSIDVAEDPGVRVHCPLEGDRWSLALGDCTYLDGTPDELEVAATQILRRVEEIRHGEHNRAVA